MGRTVEKLKVILAWPGDVKEERDRLEKVINEVNKITSKAYNLEFELFTWDTDSYLGLHVDGPQEKLDEDLKLEDAEVFIGIFWTKFGTPVLDSQSGTEHEIKRAIELWKTFSKPLVIIYFSKKPKNPFEIDYEQFQKILSFQKEFEKKGLYQSFSTNAEFEESITKNLFQFATNYSRLHEKLKDGRVPDEIIDNIPVFVDSTISETKRMNCSDDMKESFCMKILTIDRLPSTLLQYESPDIIPLEQLWSNDFNHVEKSTFLNCAEKWINEHKNFFKYDKFRKTVGLTDLGRRRLKDSFFSKDRTNEESGSYVSSISNSFGDDMYPANSSFTICQICNARFVTYPSYKKHFSLCHK